MFSNKIFIPLISLFAVLQLAGCGSVPPPKTLTPQEQLSVDTAKAKGLLIAFEKEIHFSRLATVEKYLSSLATQMAREDEVLKAEKITVKIHQDSSPELKRVFSFPGVVISIPKSFLIAIGFENELAAQIALELAQVERRELAKKMEDVKNPELFGVNSIFKISPESRGESIELGTKLMYDAGYDPRGMVSLFQKYSKYYLDSSSSAGTKELNGYIKQAQKAKNNFMPSLQPIVRSNEFLKMKKELKGSS